MTPEIRAAAEARLAELHPKLDPNWEFIDDGRAYAQQRDIAHEIRDLERQLKQMDVRVNT